MQAMNGYGPPSHASTSAYLPPPPSQPSPSTAAVVNNPKIRRGARACKACRKAKSRCEGSENPPCQRCRANEIECLFEVPQKEQFKSFLNATSNSGTTIVVEEARLLSVEQSCVSLNSKLDRVLDMLAPSHSPFARPINNITQSPSGPPWPALPGFPSPKHPLGVYGITDSITPSDTEDDVPSLKRRRRSSAKDDLIAPFEALADAAASVQNGQNGQNVDRTRLRTRMPPNAFPDVVTKGVVSMQDAKDLFSFYMRQQHDFVPILDPACDNFEAFRIRTPFCFNSILSVAVRYKTAGAPSPQVYRACIEEAQGIGRSTLYAFTVRKEAVMAMTVQASWGDPNYLSSGQALRMALELRMNKALGKLHDSPPSNTEEAREIVVCARVWLYLIYLDYQTSLSGGRPLTLHDEGTPESLPKYQTFLSHPLSQRSDARLVANVLLLNLQKRISESVVPVHINYVNALVMELDGWYADYSPKLSLQPLNRASLRLQLESAKILLYSRALALFENDEVGLMLVQLGGSAVQEALKVLLRTPEFQARIPFACQPALVEIASSCLFVLQFLKALPAHLADFGWINETLSQVSEVIQTLELCSAAKGPALTLKIALDRFKKHLKRTYPPTPLSSHSQLSNHSGLSENSPPDFDFSYLQSNVPSGYPLVQEIPQWLQAPNTLWETSTFGIQQSGHGSMESLFLPTWTNVNGPMQMQQQEGMFNGPEAGAW